MIYEDDIIEKALFAVAERMVIAATTAPKGRGESTMVTAILTGDEIRSVSEKLSEMGRTYDVSSFTRDAENVLRAPVVILFGSKVKALGLKKCGMCGFANCATKNEHPKVPCVFNTGDLGIAIGSAVSVAMDARVDNRVMYTVGQAVLELGLLGDDVSIVYAVPLSATSKNPFFDR